MASIHISISDVAKADALKALLVRSTQFAVECTEWPDPEKACVVVVDMSMLERLPQKMNHPERVVLIARSDPGLLRQAWEAGVNSVVSDEDPLNTVVLAILSACLSTGFKNEPAGPAKRRLRQ